MTPFVGQLVLFRAHDSPVAAIVTAVHADGAVDLTVFPPGQGAVSRPHLREGPGTGQWSAREDA